MSAPIAEAYNRPTIEGLVAAAERARETVRNAAAVTKLRLSELDRDLTETAKRERSGLIRSEGRAKAAEALRRTRQVRETAEAFQAMSGRRAALARAKFGSSDVEHAAIGSYWLSIMGLMDPAEVVALVRERGPGPGGGAIGFLASLVIRTKLHALESADEREVLARELEEALAAIPTDADGLQALLVKAIEAAGQAEIAALELDEAGRDPRRVLALTREHTLQAPREPTPHPAEQTAAADGGAAA